MEENKITIAFQKIILGLKIIGDRVGIPFLRTAKKDYSLIENIPRIQWSCRRGMLELDVLLGNFLNEAYPRLAQDKKMHFIELLTFTDPEIYAWILGTAPTPKEKSIAEMVEAIRLHARTRI